MRYIAAIDQGTTSTRCALVDQRGSFVAVAQLEHRQIYPRPGWVEHDAAEIWANTARVVAAALAQAAAGPGEVAAVGITNQRETTVVWDVVTGEPVGNAIVWQDTRTDEICRRLGGEAGPDRYRHVTGLPLATYFSGPKLRWILDQDPELRRRAEDGELRFGTIDAFLAWKLTGEHVTDVTNASRTMLMDLGSLDWSPELLDAFGIPAAMLPRIVPSVGPIAECRQVLAGVPLAGILGDQQSAMFGQACFGAGDAKNTYGTGCFALLGTGTRRVHSDHGLLTTVAYRVGDEPARYALEGSVAIAGAGVQWLRDNLRMIDAAPEVQDLAESVDDNGDVYFVPAFSGLFAPHWRPDARGIIAGLTRFSTAGHIARAVLEATAYQTRDVLDAMERDAGVPFEELRVDGGMAGNDLLMQFQADILGVPVVVPRVTETTVLGAAYAAGLASGFWSDMEELRGHWREARRFTPSMAESRRAELYGGWQKAVTKSFGWT